MEVPMRTPESRLRKSTLEAAKHVGLSTSTLAKLRVFGGGPRYAKLGRRVVYASTDLDAWLATTAPRNMPRQTLRE